MRYFSTVVFALALIGCATENGMAPIAMHIYKDSGSSGEVSGHPADAPSPEVTGADIASKDGSAPEVAADIVSKEVTADTIVMEVAADIPGTGPETSNKPDSSPDANKPDVPTCFENGCVAGYGCTKNGCQPLCGTSGIACEGGSFHCKTPDKNHKEYRCVECDGWAIPCISGKVCNADGVCMPKMG